MNPADRLLQEVLQTMAEKMAKQARLVGVEWTPDDAKLIINEAYRDSWKQIIKNVFVRLNEPPAPI